MTDSDTIQYNQSIIIRSEKCYRVVRVCKGQLAMNKSRFSFANAIGCRVGSSFEIKNHHLHPVASEVANESDQDDSDNNAEKSQIDNLADDNNKIAMANVQKMGACEVLQLKQEGISADRLIEKLVENNANFAHRTEFSQEKYIRKKKKKHSNIVTFLEPSLRILAEIFYSKDTDKVCGLRIDSLALMLNFSNVQHGSKVIVVENCAGLVSAGVVERLGGSGCLVHFHRHDQVQAIPVLEWMNFPPEVMACFHPVSLDCVSNVQKCKDGETELLQKSVDDKDVEMDEEKRSKIEKRRETRARKLVALNLYEESQFDALILACRQNPLDLLKKLSGKLLPSSQIVVYSQHVLYLLECYKWLREKECAVNLRLSENFYRRYQVLPGRTHPEMNQMVVGGYLLTGIFVEP